MLVNLSVCHTVNISHKQKTLDLHCKIAVVVFASSNKFIHNNSERYNHQSWTPIMLCNIIQFFELFLADGKTDSSVTTRD